MPPPDQGSRLVLVSPHIDDHNSVRRILHPSLWHIDGFFTGREGLDFLRRHRDVAVLICEERLPDSDWNHMMRQLDSSLVKPSFIVSARLADDRLWAEVLNVGAFDLLLAAPFEAEEVIRVTESARLAWNRACGRSALPARTDQSWGAPEGKARAAS